MVPPRRHFRGRAITTFPACHSLEHTIASALDELIAQLVLLAVDTFDGGLLRQTIEAFYRSAATAVPSLLGLRLTLATGGRPMSLTALTQPLDVHASLRIRLSSDPVRDVVVYAREPHACDQLGADIPALLDVRRDRVVVDDDLHPDAGDVHHQIEERSRLDTALGMLLERGMSFEDGHREIALRAERAGSSLVEAADRVIDGSGGEPGFSR